MNSTPAQCAGNLRVIRRHSAERADNGFDQLTTATPVAGRPPACGTGSSETLAYDALGRKGQASDASGTFWTHYDGTGTAPVFQEQQNAAQLTVYEPDASGVATAVTLQWVATQYLEGDGQGSVGYLTVASQNPQCALYYDPYGAGLWSQSQTNACETGSEYSQLGYQFAGRTPQTGQYSFGARLYDPTKAAFLTPDAYHPGSTTADVSVGTDPLTEDRYAYVNGDPLNLVDPNGHRACADDACYVYAVVHPGVVTQHSAITGQFKSFANEEQAFHRNAAIDRYIAAVYQYIQHLSSAQHSADREMSREDALQLHACGQDLPCVADVHRADFLPTACPDLLNCIGDAIANHKMDIFLTAVTALVEVVPGVGEAADAALYTQYASEARDAAGLAADSAAADSSALDEAGATCGGLSFSADTRVLLANGSTLAISKLWMR